MARSKAFQTLVEKEPSNPMFRFSLGQALWQEGEMQAACEHLQFAAGAKSDWMMPLILLGKCQLALQQKESARTTFNSALQLAVAQGHEEPEAELRALLSSL
jgi:Flp pilus assembly protein TadD